MRSYIRINSDSKNSINETFFFSDEETYYKIKSLIRYLHW